MYLYSNKSILNYKKGMGIPNLSGTSLSSIIIPLPPLSEQQAIVSKIETLLAKCDRLQVEIENMNRDSKELLRVLFNETFGSGK
jgi:type I restriction enzyme S subunit